MEVGEEEWMAEQDVPSRDQEWPDNMPLEEQVQRLGKFILDLDAGYPNRSAGACEMAVQMLSDYRYAMGRAMNELGVPGPGYPAPAANAYAVLDAALAGRTEDEEAEL